MAPESNHTSIRSVSRVIFFPDDETRNISSATGRCMSNVFSFPLTGFSFMKPALTDLSISFSNSSSEPMQHSSVPSSVRQIGRGIPQYLERDKFQSTKFSSQFPNL